VAPATAIFFGMLAPSYRGARHTGSVSSVNPLTRRDEGM
jgi:hypothetical protein